MVLLLDLLFFSQVLVLISLELLLPWLKGRRGRLAKILGPRPRQDNARGTLSVFLFFAGGILMDAEFFDYGTYSETKDVTIEGLRIVRS